MSIICYCLLILPHYTSSIFVFMCRDTREFAKDGFCLQCHPECRKMEGSLSCNGTVSTEYCPYYPLYITLKYHCLVSCNVLYSDRVQTLAFSVHTFVMGWIVCLSVLMEWWEKKDKCINTPVHIRSVCLAMRTVQRGECSLGVLNGKPVLKCQDSHFA